MHRFALALVLAMTTAGPTAANDAPKAPAPEDRYLWLEDVTGEKALDWARARNAESAKVLETRRLRRAREAHPRHPRLGRPDPVRREARALVLQLLARREEPPRALAADDARRVPQGAPGLGDGDRPRRPRRGREGELGLARGRLPEAGVQALPRPALARRGRRGRGARVRPRGQGVREGRLLPARVQEQRGLARRGHPLRRHRLRPRLDDHLRLPADREGLEAGHAARRGGDGLRGPGGGRRRSAPSATTRRASSGTSSTAG